MLVRLTPQQYHAARRAQARAHRRNLLIVAGLFAGGGIAIAAIVMSGWLWVSQ